MVNTVEKVRTPISKVFTWEQAKQWRFTQKGKVVFTNGVFDLIHPGHLDILFGARAFGDRMIVAVNSDESVKRLKGPTRPIRNQIERSYVLAGIEAVDAVVIFDQDTPFELITLLQPDVLVKGGDYTEETIVGAKEVRARSGEVIVIPLTEGQSTTSIINKLRS